MLQNEDGLSPVTPLRLVSFEAPTFRDTLQALQMYGSSALVGRLPRNRSKSRPQEITVRKTKHEPKPAMVARIQAEARAALAQRTEKRSRFLDAALSNGPDVEPAGRLAG